MVGLTMKTVSLSLYNKIANDILLEVKPVKLRKQIIPQILDLITDQLDTRVNEIFEKLDKIMNSYYWDLNNYKDTLLGQDILKLAKENGVEV
jgi:hypothetical protein